MIRRHKPISLKFVLFFIASIIGITIYLLYPSQENYMNTKRSFEEQLKYSQSRHKPQRAEEIQIQKVKKEIPLIRDENYTQKINETKIAEIRKQIPYNELLDNLIKLQKNHNIAEIIVRDILEQKGFDKNTVNIILKDINQNQVKTQGTTMVAQFDFKTGIITISNNAIYSLDKGVLIAVIAHELDHFEKIAQIFKSMTEDEFNNFISENNLSTINIDFWKNAIKYANIKNFDKKTYTDALTRLINHKNVGQNSLYSDFYCLSENMRNPLEISAYNVSDYIYEYYNIPIVDGPMKKLTEKFNELDWALYNLTNNNSDYKEERITFFNYFFAKAINNKFPKYKNIYNECIKYNNGILTTFWNTFKTDYADFFINGNATPETVNTFIALFEEAISLTKNRTQSDIANALYLSIADLKQNIQTEESYIKFKKTVETHFKITKNNNSLSEKDELDAILTLICIENNLKQSEEKDISLFYIKIPTILNQYYTMSKHQKFKFIYENNEFRRLLEERELNSESKLLTQLLNENRIKA